MSDEVKIKRMCPQCGHKHRKGVFCHAYLQAAVNDDDDEEDGSGDNEEGEDDDGEEDLLGTKVEKEPVFADKAEVIDELPTPVYVQRIKYIRCNCQIGVPMSKEYEQVGRVILCGNIIIKQYDDIQNERFAPPPKLLSKEEEEVLELARHAVRSKKQMEIIPLVLRFLRQGGCSAVPKVSTTWRDATELYQEYTDVRNMAPWQAFRPHKGEVHSLCLLKPRVFSGGDKRIVACDIYRGEFEAVVTRDSGDVTHLSISDRGELYAASTNGSVRTYSLNHNPRMIKIMKTMWDHSRAVSSVMMGVPSIGPCAAHGLGERALVVSFVLRPLDPRINIDVYEPVCNPPHGRLTLAFLSSPPHHAPPRLATAQRTTSAGCSRARRTVPCACGTSKSTRATGVSPLRCCGDKPSRA